MTYTKRSWEEVQRDEAQSLLPDLRARIFDLERERRESNERIAELERKLKGRLQPIPMDFETDP